MVPREGQTLEILAPPAQKSQEVVEALKTQKDHPEFSLGVPSPDDARRDGPLSLYAGRKGALQDPGSDGRADVRPDQGEPEDADLHAARTGGVRRGVEAHLRRLQPAQASPALAVTEKTA